MTHSNMNATNDINKVYSNLDRSVGNNVTFLRELFTALSAMEKDRDTTRLAVKMDKWRNEKRATYAISAASTLVRCVFEGATVRTNKKTGKTQVKIAKTKVREGALAKIATFVSAGNGAQDKAVKDWIKEVLGIVAADWDVNVWADRAVKAHPEALEAMIAALQARRPGNVA